MKIPDAQKQALFHNDFEASYLTDFNERNHVSNFLMKI